MKKRIATFVAGLGLMAALVPLGGTAHAAECAGSPAFPETFVCIIRREIGTITVKQGPVVHTPPLCALLLCIEEQAIPLVDIEIDDDEVVVVYYMGKCYYIGNGAVTVAPASSTNPPTCP